MTADNQVSVCDDSHNGDVGDFNIFTGKEGNRVEVGLGENVVWKLCDRIAGKKYTTFIVIIISQVCICSRIFLKVTLVEQFAQTASVGQST